jgi:hypothetical protein
MRKLTGALIALLFGLSGSAHASTVIEYTFFAQFAAGSTNSVVTAQFIVPTFITSDTTIFANQFVSCSFVGFPCTDAKLTPNLFIQDQNETVDTITVEPGGPAKLYVFPGGTFDRTGTSLDFSGTALLEVEQVEATPLPAALPLFAGGLGLLGFFGAKRRRKTAAPQRFSNC